MTHDTNPLHPYFTTAADNFRYLAKIGWFAAAIESPAEVDYCLKASRPA